MVFAKSSSCISALVLRDNEDVPAYTASAPYKKAVLVFSKEPAGANNSGFFIIYSPFFIYFILYYKYFLKLYHNYDFISTIYLLF